MSRRRRWTAAGVAAVAAALMWTTATAVPAHAAAPGLSISAPSSASLGSQPVGARTFSASLGPVRVGTGSLLVHNASWVATVSTTGFRTGSGSAAETVPPASVSYRSGPATASSGLSLSLCTAGQLVAAQPLDRARTAFTCSGTSLLSSTSLTWNPTLTITVSDANVVGTYTGTVVHSVA